MNREEQKTLFAAIDGYADAGIYVMKQELELVVPQHTHRQGHILVVLDGVATLNVEHRAYYIPNGYFLWVPPEVPHQVVFEGKRVMLLNIYYPAAFAEVPFYVRVGAYPIPSILYHVMELVAEGTRAYTPDDWRYELLATTHHILPHIIQRQEHLLMLPTTTHPVGKRIVTYIQRHYREPLTAQQVATEVGMSVRSLSRYLAGELHTTFVQYLRTYRVVMAIKAIVKAEESITNIAYSVGYESLTAFSNAFYAVTGSRPSQFIKEQT